jgi:hypothetical protein
MKNVYKLCAVCLVAICLFAANSASAQCNLVTKTDAGVILTITVTCDFPIYLSTGNLQADGEAYDAAKLAWVNANTNAHKQMENGSSYFEIHKYDFYAMPEKRQAAILEDPSTYHIIE